MDFAWYMDLGATNHLTHVIPSVSSNAFLTKLFLVMMSLFLLLSLVVFHFLLVFLFFICLMFFMVFPFVKILCLLLNSLEIFLFELSFILGVILFVTYIPVKFFVKANVQMVYVMSYCLLFHPLGPSKLSSPLSHHLPSGIAILDILLIVFLALSLLNHC